MGSEPRISGQTVAQCENDPAPVTLIVVGPLLTTPLPKEKDKSDRLRPVTEAIVNLAAESVTLINLMGRHEVWSDGTVHQLGLTQIGE